MGQADKLNSDIGTDGTLAQPNGNLEYMGLSLNVWSLVSGLRRRLRFNSITSKSNQERDLGIVHTHVACMLNCTDLVYN